MRKIILIAAAAAACSIGAAAPAAAASTIHTSGSNPVVSIKSITPVMSPARPCYPGIPHCGSY